MSFLKTKEVKKCICGKEPKAVIIYDDKMQARKWLLILGDSLLLIAGVLALTGGYDEDTAKDSWWVFALVANFWLFFASF